VLTTVIEKGHTIITLPHFESSGLCMCTVYVLECTVCQASHIFTSSLYDFLQEVSQMAATEFVVLLVLVEEVARFNSSKSRSL